MVYGERVVVGSLLGKNLEKRTVMRERERQRESFRIKNNNFHNFGDEQFIDRVFKTLFIC